jgi:aspartate/tyrosine/aromatic aminotransferase
LAVQLNSSWTFFLKCCHNPSIYDIETQLWVPHVQI